MGYDFHKNQINVILEFIGIIQGYCLFKLFLEPNPIKYLVAFDLSNSCINLKIHYFRLSSFKYFNNFLTIINIYTIAINFHFIYFLSRLLHPLNLFFQSYYVEDLHSIYNFSYD